jgi:glucoamylase
MADPAPRVVAQPQELPPPRSPAFGRPGMAPTWAAAAKQGVGTALHPASTVWFTLAEGVVTEVYYPRVDTPNTRDLQLLTLLPGGEVVEERRDMDAEVSLAAPDALAYKITTTDRRGRFQIEKRVITDPDRPSLALRVRWRPLSGTGAEPPSEAPGTDPAGAAQAAPTEPAGPARLFVLLAPHIYGHGAGNTARVISEGGRTLLCACRHTTWLALAASRPFERASCGFVGASDGWTDLHAHGDMRWTFDAATDGNVALMGELAPGFAGHAFTVALGFGGSLQEAVANCLATADAPFRSLETRYRTGWKRWCQHLEDLAPASGDGGRLYRISAMTLKAHEDKENPGAHIASLAVPWGEASGDSNAGGYHLVWPRDLYHSATGRLAAGDAEGAVAALRYLFRTQRADGSWPQNFWTFGESYWRGLQLDELAFPILLAWQCHRAGALPFDPYPSLVAPAAYAVARIGPVTPQERWEENGGYSPSTLASCIAALACAAEMAAQHADPFGAQYFLEVADCWSAYLEDWTYTTLGDLAGGFTEYYERVVDPGHDGVRRAVTIIKNQPGAEALPARSVIDGGFLELVRYGVRGPRDEHILKSIAAYDAACRVELPQGPCWHRYNHDGYGQKADGGPYNGTGIGRPWPLLTGERAHYELAAGGDARRLRAALEGFANQGGMIPEQVWDGEPLPGRGLVPGGPTGSAAPLCWAHAEYIKLLRSLRDGAVFDCPAPVRARYATGLPAGAPAIWKFNNKLRRRPAGRPLLIEVYAPAALHWSDDGWASVHHDPMEPRGHGVWTYLFPHGVGPVQFTFYWHDEQRWEGRDFEVSVG